MCMLKTVTAIWEIREMGQLKVSLGHARFVVLGLLILGGHMWFHDFGWMTRRYGCQVCCF